MAKGENTSGGFLLMTSNQLRVSSSAGQGDASVIIGSKMIDLREWKIIGRSLISLEDSSQP